VLSFSFSDAPWRYYLRQEPDAAIPHVRIRAGGRPRGRSLPRQGSTFKDHTPSDRSSFSGILLGIRHEETGKR
jgi:hypothetical protein